MDKAERARQKRLNSIYPDKIKPSDINPADVLPSLPTYLFDLLHIFEKMENNGHASRLSYIGDKQKYIPPLLGIMPDYETLTEPYGGMGAVSRLALLHDEADAAIDGGLHQRRRIVYGDLNADNINLFTIIRDAMRGAGKMPGEGNALRVSNADL